MTNMQSPLNEDILLTRYRLGKYTGGYLSVSDRAELHSVGISGAVARPGGEVGQAPMLLT